MYKHLLICNIIFISTIGGKTISLVNSTTTTIPVASVLSQNNNNHTQTVISEGESIIPNKPVTLPNGNYIALINLEKELSANKQKSVVPRKGVNPQDDIKDHDEVETNKSTKNIPNMIKKPVAIETYTRVSNDANIFNDVHDANSMTIHKPLVVSSEALAKMDKINNVDIDENSPSIKIHAMKAGSHPGMIMPIVITILVVPMFAVVGYLALKRGQEAWKNRHYKRMDFLLDGMYND